MTHKLTTDQKGSKETGSREHPGKPGNLRPDRSIGEVQTARIGKAAKRRKQEDTPSEKDTRIATEFLKDPNLFQITNDLIRQSGVVGEEITAC